MKLIYLDHNATTPIHPEVKSTVIEALDLFGNASSLHPFGFKAREAIESVRTRLLRFLGATEGRIIFTSGGSESNNLVLKGLVCEGSICPHRLAPQHRPHVITSSVEHDSVLTTISCLNRIGADVTVLNVDGTGMVDPDDVFKAIRPTTVLVSIMMANNEVGTIQPIAAIGRRLRERGIAFHCDAVQTVGKLPVDVDDLNVDYLALSGHKLNAPKGVGALYIRRTMSLCPLIHGGHQEGNLRAGTENNIGIIALGKAIEVAGRDREEDVRRIQALRDRLHDAIVHDLDGVHLNGHEIHRLPGTLNLSFEKVDGAAILEMLAMHGIAASTGSACSSGDDAPSHVLVAMGIAADLARSALRFSLGYGNTDDEIDEAASIIVKTVKQLRALSPL